MLLQCGSNNNQSKTMKHMAKPEYTELAVIKFMADILKFTNDLCGSYIHQCTVCI